MKKSGIKRNPLTFNNSDNYFIPSIYRTPTPSDFITQEVLQFYEQRYGSSVYGKEPKKSKTGKFQKEAQVFGGVGSLGSGAPVAVTVPQPYLPEFASPDRLFYPTDPRTAMKYWRYFYALDPVCGNVIDMYGELLLSDFELAGEGIDNEIKDQYWRAIEECNALSQFRWMVIGFLVDGEVIPHLVWDDSEGIWIHLGFQDPMNVKVYGVPFSDASPLLELQISQELRKILTNRDPRFEKFRERVPIELLDLIERGQPIVLDTEEKVTFIPRRLVAYDVRGVSIFSRLWRVLLYEDAIFNASIQTARRHAFPVKVIKLGAPTGYIPSPEQEEKLRKLLAIAETDPHAWLIYHQNVNFEAWGTTERGMTIGREWDIIERIKLVALGVSRAFLHGEVTYASAEKGLQIFLDRLKGLRTFFEQTWWYPRFFGIMAKKNGWIRPTQAEVAHRVKVKRSTRELIRDRRYLIPTIVWEKSLDSQKKEDLIRVYAEMEERLKVRISRAEKMAVVGLDWEEQERKVREEEKRLMELDKEYGIVHPEESLAGMPAGAPAGMELGAPPMIPEVPAGVGEVPAPEATEAPPAPGGEVVVLPGRG